VTVLEAIGFALSAAPLLSALGGSTPAQETESRIIAAHDAAVTELTRDTPRWRDIEPVNDSFLARASNMQMIIQAGLGLIDRLDGAELDLTRFDDKGDDDPELLALYSAAFQSAISRDAVLSTLTTVKDVANVVHATLDPHRLRQVHLNRALADSKKRMVSHAISAGLTEPDAVRLSDELYAIHQSQADDLIASKRVHVMVAPVGSGKSAFAECVFRTAVAAAMTDSQSAPVWLDSQSLRRGTLFEQVHDQVKALGDPAGPSLCIIIDGLDELDASVAARLLDEARAIHATDGATVLATTRPLPLRIEPGESLQCPPLLENDMLRLVSLAAARDIKSWEASHWPESIREAAKLPLFALLTGLWLRQNPRVPATTGELVEHLIRHALPDEARKYAEASDWLMQLAAQSTFQAGPVAARDLPHTGDLGVLTDSGLVQSDNGMLRFSLAVIQEWFAARALLARVVEAAQLLSQPTHLSRWRGALRVMLELAPSAFVDEVLIQLVELDPGFVGDLLEEGSSPLGDRRESPPITQPVKAGEQVRQATIAFGDALGSLGDLVTPIGLDGQVQAVGVQTHGQTISLTWLRERPSEGDVIQLVAGDIRLDGQPSKYAWTRSITRCPGEKSYWPWRWAHEGIREALTQMLKDGVPLTTSGPIHEEAIWAAASKLVKHSWVTGPISIETLTTEIDNLRRIGLPDDCYFHGYPKGLDQPLLQLRPHIEAMRGRGETELRQPWPQSDAKPSGSGPTAWIWDFFTPEQLRLRIQSVYAGALQAYEDLATGVLAPLSPHLRSAALFPVHLRFFLEFGGDELRGPGGTWHFVPLPLGSSNQVTVEIVDSPPSPDVLFSEAREAAARRPDLAEASLGGVTSTIIDVFGARPMTEICYQWLADDLARVHWTKEHTRIDLQ